MISEDVILYNIIPFLSCRDTNMRFISHTFKEWFDEYNIPLYNLKDITRCIKKNNTCAISFLQQHRSLYIRASSYLSLLYTITLYTNDAAYIFFSSIMCKDKKAARCIDITDRKYRNIISSLHGIVHNDDRYVDVIYDSVYMEYIMLNHNSKTNDNIFYQIAEFIKPFRRHWIYILDNYCTDAVLEMLARSESYSIDAIDMSCIEIFRQCKYRDRIFFCVNSCGHGYFKLDDISLEENICIRITDPKCDEVVSLFMKK